MTQMNNNMTKATMKQHKDHRSGLRTPRNEVMTMNKTEMQMIMKEQWQKAKAQNRMIDEVLMWWNDGTEQKN